MRVPRTTAFGGESGPSAGNGSRDRCDHLRLLADRRLDGDREILVARADLRDQFGEVLFQMAACAEEHRHHPQGTYAIGIQRRRAIRQRRLHQFQEREHDTLAGQQLAEFGYELQERPRPVRVARAVGEEDESSLGHAAIIAESRTTSPSRINAGPPEPFAATAASVPSVP